MQIFVAKLNFKTRREDLEAAFSFYGKVVSARIVRDKTTGRSKGYGFVEMATEEEGLSAIQGMNEKELDGKIIVVAKANARPASV